MHKKIDINNTVFLLLIKMPGLSRDQKFKIEFNKYINTWKNNNIDIPYSIRNITPNKISHRHAYILTIYQLHDLELNPIDNSNIPTVSDFIRNMDNYFTPYYDNNSYIFITTTPSDEPISVINFKVVYYKDKYPFPNEIHNRNICIENYEKRIQSYIEEVEELETIVDYERIAKNRYKNRINLISVNIQKNFQLMYEKNNILEDCPVCLDPIATDNIIIPVCFHNICNACYTKCKKCPICRDKYIKIPSRPIT